MTPAEAEASTRAKALVKAKAIAMAKAKASTDRGAEISLEDGDLSIIPDIIGQAVSEMLPAREISSKTPVLLMVEDDEVDAEVLTRLVQRLPEREWKVRHATTLAAALDVIRFEKPDIALVDLNLADAWYGDTVQALVEAAPDCPIIVQTGLDDPEVPAEMLRLGAQDFLQKGSITLDSLSRSIRYSLARHQTLGALRKTWTSLSDANAELDEFAHVVAHDLRAPARTARMLSSRLVQELPENASELAFELGERLELALGTMDDMILSMLDYAGLRRGVGNFTEVLLSETVSAAAATIEADLSEVGGSIEIAIDEDLEVQADAQLLKRVVHNIIGNSIKYRSPDRQVVIKVTAVADGDSTEIRFSDNGPGVPNLDRERVFGILERLGHKEVSGLGFGLAICRRIVDSLDGAIWIEAAEPDTGCTVVVKLMTAAAELEVSQ